MRPSNYQICEHGTSAERQSDRGIKRVDALLEYAVMHGDAEEAERLREKLKRLTEKV